jgi:organic anion transporter 3A
MSLSGTTSSVNLAARTNGEYAEVTVVPVATAGPCNSSCHTIYPFLILLFFMTFIVAITQMPLLMIVLRSVSEEERSFALGMQFVIFRLFGYIPAPILFGNLIDSTCLLWKSTCGSKGGRCLLYDIEQFRYRYVGLCAGIKILALGIFVVDWWLVRRRKQLDEAGGITTNEIVGSIISLDKLFEEKPHHESGHRRNLSSVSTYECPTSPKHSTTSENDTNTACVAAKNELLATVGPDDVNISQEAVNSQQEDVVDEADLERRHT